VGFGSGFLVQPVYCSRQVHGCGGQDELQMSFVQASVAGTPPVQRKHALGNRSLNTSALAIALVKSCRVLRPFMRRDSAHMLA